MKGISEVSGANCGVMGARARRKCGDNLDNDVELIYVARSVVLLAGRKLTGGNAVHEMFSPASSTVKSVHLCTLYSKTCLKRNAIVPVFFFPFSQVSVLQRVVF